MDINWSEIREKAESFVNEAGRKIKQYTPENWSPEKKFVNAIVASMALMTVSDKKVDTREVKASMDFINQIDQIAELEMQQEAIELYEMHLEKLMPNLDNGVKWTIESAKLLGDIAKVKEYPQYAPMIRNLIDYLSSSDGEQSSDEIEMKNRILETIS
jgi:tellurite resistance protein